MLYFRKKISGQRMRTERIRPEEWLPTAVLMVLFLLGFLSGTLCGLKAVQGSVSMQPWLDKVYAWFGGGYLDIAGFLLKLYCLCELLIVITGVSVFGVGAIPAVFLLFGAVNGFICGGFFDAATGREVLFEILLFIPLPVLYGTALSYTGVSAGFLSLKLIAFVRNKTATGKIDVKKYLTANALILVAGTAAALLESGVVRILHGLLF